jgi:hypothetical protein
MSLCIHSIPCLISLSATLSMHLARLSIALYPLASTPHNPIGELSCALCRCFYSRLTALYVCSAVPSSIHSITIVVLSTRARAVLRAFTYGRAASTPRRPARPPTAPNSIHFTHRLCFTALQNYGHARRVSRVHAREAHPREADRGGRPLFALTLSSAWSNPSPPCASCDSTRLGRLLCGATRTYARVAAAEAGTRIRTIRVASTR